MARLSSAGRRITIHYYQIHGKRISAAIGETRQIRVLSGDPLIPLLRDPRLLLDTPDPEGARRDAARLAAFFDVRYVVIHGEYLDAGTFERLDHFVADNFPQASRRVDGTVVAYDLRRPDPSLWPERYVIDFGDERREFALLTGWWSNERWAPSGPTMQWANDRESSLRLFLLFVTHLAVLLDDAPVLRRVLVVMAAETAGRIDVTNVVRVRAPRHVHRGEHVSRPEILRPRDRALDD